MLAAALKDPACTAKRKVLPCSFILAASFLDLPHSTNLHHPTCDTCALLSHMHLLGVCYYATWRSPRCLISPWQTSMATQLDVPAAASGDRRAAHRTGQSQCRQDIQRQGCGGRLTSKSEPNGWNSISILYSVEHHTVFSRAPAHCI